MRPLISILFVGILLVGCSNKSSVSPKELSAAQQMESEADRLNKKDPQGSYGSRLTLDKTTTISEILKTPESYVGKRLRLHGQVEEVCPMRGCWIQLREPSTDLTLRVKVTDGQIVFPLSAAGRAASVEGVFEKIEMSLEDSIAYKKHQADELGHTFDPSSVTEPLVIWRLQGQGAEIK
ncbi:MAG: DUF4920 domain-containing protein [Candidatus Eisenbacteria bacterium]|uniref:DUF4920 domain-containing protein n=1 Tax=Eiseniibacteriota bacterium TaxID=2212470 RepID=A0A7Y2ECD6_UNCEI|nr:DUF4920 domain-containing protein [Candidatus Eisenbacteria bacterium]